MVNSSLNPMPEQPSPPIIETMEFLGVIIGAGKPNHGNLYFHNGDGDGNRLTLDVVSAVNFGAAAYNPGPYLIARDYSSGVFQVYIWC